MNAREALKALTFEDDADSDWQAVVDRTGALQQAAELLQYLEITLVDYATASASFVASIEELKGGISEDEAVNRIIEQGEAAAVVHLRIDTFYVFAKILLDKLAQGIERFFGPTQARGASLSSHRNLRKNLASFAAEKGLTSPDHLVRMADSLAETVVDYRDWSIVHTNSPRSAKAVGFSAETKLARSIPMIRHRQPTPGEIARMKESDFVPSVMTEIESYVGAVVAYLASNR